MPKPTIIYTGSSPSSHKSSRVFITTSTALLQSSTLFSVFPNFAPPAEVLLDIYTVRRVHLFGHPLLKHFEYSQYGCGMQSAGLSSTMTPQHHFGCFRALTLAHYQQFSKICLPPALVLHCQGKPI